MTCTCAACEGWDGVRGWRRHNGGRDVTYSSRGRRPAVGHHGRRLDEVVHGGGHRGRSGADVLEQGSRDVWLLLLLLLGILLLLLLLGIVLLLLKTGLLKLLLLLRILLLLLLRILLLETGLLKLLQRLRKPVLHLPHIVECNRRHALPAR